MTVLVTSLVLLWVIAGLATAWLLARRGHQLFGWSLFGAFFGPLTALLAVDHLRRLHRTPASRLTAGRRHSGSVDVLVGIDGGRGGTDRRAPDRR